MKTSSCLQPEINFFHKKIVNPLGRKVVSDSTIVFEKNFEKTFQSYLVETIYLNSNEDLDKETGFMTDREMNEFILNYKQVKTIGPKLNFHVNNIEVDHETSDFFEMHLNLVSDPSDSLLYCKRNKKVKDGKFEEVESSEKCVNSSDIFRNNHENEEIIVMRGENLEKDEKKLFENRQKLTNGEDKKSDGNSDIKKTGEELKSKPHKICNCACLLF